MTHRPARSTSNAIGADAATGGALILVTLRGGLDGLSAVVPLDEQAYADARRSIAVPASDTRALDDRFGLHPALAPLHELYADGRLGIVHAVGQPASGRSHFDAQDQLDRGAPRPGARGAGWIARALDAGGPSIQAVALGRHVPASLRGGPALVMRDLASFGLGGRSGAMADAADTLERLHAGDRVVATAGREALDAVAAITAAVVIPEGEPDPLADAAALLGADLGVRAVCVDLGGWDTHDAMGTPTEGRMTTLLEDLGNRLAAMQAALDHAGRGDVLTLVVTEFGRRLAENGSGGTDHGRASVALALGDRVRGGRVLGTWPGLAADDLDDGDLRVTTDVRDLLWEVTQQVLAHPDPATVFPDLAHQPVGLIA